MIRTGIVWFAVLLFQLPAWSFAADSGQPFTLLLTSNLHGEFSTSEKKQEDEDPMLVMAQSLIREREKNSKALMIDLGNAFYPGLLSKFSYGSVTMDYLDYFGFSATLISSNDLNIGLGNLNFLSQSKKTTLLSANIEKNGQTVFAPYFTTIIRGKKIGFIGISSPVGHLDVAEKQLFEANFADVHAVLASNITRLKNENADYIVVLSGLSYEGNLDLMEKHQDVALCISGGDFRGKLYSSRASRIDIASGRSLITLVRPDGYYTLNLDMKKGLDVQALTFSLPEPSDQHPQEYTDFLKRLKLWKSQFASEGNQVVAEDVAMQVPVDGKKTAELLRDRFGTEIALLDRRAISAGGLSGRVSYSDILFMINDDFPLFTYRITGKELKQLLDDRQDLLAAGVDDGSVQGYPISEMREYTICSTQPVFEQVEKLSERKIRYENSWLSISDVICSDLKGEKVITKDDFRYLDERFVVLVDISLANFFEQSDVSRGDAEDVPVGKPTDSYTKWGMENKIDLTLYNRFHQLILTPYIYFVSKDEDYLQNQLRGTLVYTYNLHPNAKPYHKSQADTVVQEVDDKRPLMFRETAGVLFETEYLTGKLGLGFEKQTRDPAKQSVAGFECLADSRFDIWDNVAYRFSLDSFYGFERARLDDIQVRIDITNAVSFKLNSFLALSAKHKWAYFDSADYEQKYTESHFIVAFDLTTDFKLF